MKNNIILKQITKVEIFFLIGLVCVMSLTGCDNSTAQPKNTTLTKNGKPKQNKSSELLAPDFSLADLEGNTVTLDQMRGKVVLLNFWGTWCGPCRKEIPDFINLMKKHKKDGLEIVGVTLTSGPPENIKTFADKWGINYKLLTDINGNESYKAFSDYCTISGVGMRAVPTTFLIDRDGYIVRTYRGARPGSVFLRDLKPYL